MDAITQTVIYTIGGGLGLWIATKIFSSPSNVAQAAAIAFFAALADLIPTVGFAASLIVLVVGAKLATRCDLTEAIIAALVARATVFVLAFTWALVLA